MLHRTYRFGMGYSTAGKHYITINGKMITGAISQVTDSPILNTKGKISLPSMSVSVIGIKYQHFLTLIMCFNSTLTHFSYQRV